MHNIDYGFVNMVQRYYYNEWCYLCLKFKIGVKVWNRDSRMLIIIGPILGSNSEFNGLDGNVNLELVPFVVKQM